jgi:N-acetyl-anhydromuramyl-L-alanine amidase AmpD
VAAIDNRVTELERQALELQPDLGQCATLAQEVLSWKRAAENLAEGAGQLETGLLREAVMHLETEMDMLCRELYGAALTSPVEVPELVDVRWTLPAAANRSYPARSLGAIRQIVIGHTATLEDVTPDRLAQTHMEQGKPSIACHFLVSQDGTTYWTQSLELAVGHTLQPQINQESIGVALSGNFNSESPSPTQLQATAALLAWLVSIFDVDLAAVCGRRELEDVASPGTQWSDGVGYGKMLLAAVRARLAKGRGMPAPAQSAVAFANAAATKGPVSKPNLVDVVSSLPRHPTLAPYPTRLKPVSVIAIHHTDSLKSVTVQQLAQYHVYGTRQDAKGNVIKAEWPGIGYHFVIASDGTIYQCQREQTRSYHVGGPANEYCLGVSFIGRFMRLGFDGKEQSAADQIPTAAQLKSGGQLIAWLMQELNVSPEKVMGHRNVVSGTVCPGEHWEDGLKWRALLQTEIQAAIDAAPECDGNQPMEHYLLFWDHGTSWAAADWNNAQNYIAHFRPTTGFSVEDALQARHVTIVGGPGGVSPADEARLRAACIHVNRLSGATVAATKAMLDALVAQDTPWPGAPRAQGTESSPEAIPSQTLDDLTEDNVEIDEWTVPDNWDQLLASAGSMEPVSEQGEIEPQGR